MATDLKPTVSPAQTLDLLDIRLGRVLKAEPAPGTPKPAYRLTVDFGKFGTRVSVGRFTGHTPQELIGAQVLGVLNFEPRPVGDSVSEVLILGVQLPGAPSGDATPLVPLHAAKLGSKVF
ncbi:tRNA-binding protein [Deinococcus actinosclerus]|uniref:tRNA-binding protein n=1 Tax=Deinococcus actinosclerus TaxID=1768108 RepID=A0ABN4K3G7_9DEIO|nr:tRNA-binding protein [Deinococcus actinosclerus]ALW87641.1 tRNA-binding protein [Deinococcus actinosclerus]